tara:strand:+ start:678 stop:1658 length:981 start_codon:yes stop_codon:yes gene_type:complete
MTNPYYKFDSQFRENKNSLILGIDEVGRGPLIGPVVTAGVILNPKFNNIEIKDSKKLSEIRLNKLYHIIQNNSKEIIIEIAWEEKIDELNILGATLSCFKLIIANSNNISNKILIDGNKVPINASNIKFIKKGDSKSLSIAAASIIAKVKRDNIMKQLDKIFPEYEFKNNKGYGTKKHLDAIRKYGSLAIHRKSFKPIIDFIRPISNLNDFKTIILGKKYAAVSLIKAGYDIEEFNYSESKFGQIDIIHLENDELVFSLVNVILNSEKLENPLFQITSKEINNFISFSRIYIDEKGFVGNIRFDVISIRFIDGNPHISEIKNGISS